MAAGAAPVWGAAKPGAGTYPTLTALGDREAYGHGPGFGGSRRWTLLGAYWQFPRFRAACVLRPGSRPARSGRQLGLARISVGGWYGRALGALRRGAGPRARPHLLQQAAGAGALRRGRVEQRAHVARQRARRAQLLAALHGLCVARAEARHRLRRQRGRLRTSACCCHAAATSAARRWPARRSPACSAANGAALCDPE